MTRLGRRRKVIPKVIPGGGEEGASQAKGVGGVGGGEEG